MVKYNTGVKRDLLRDGQVGRFFRGNLHCHSNRSDGLVDPEEVVGAYREAGYHFICISDHFEADYGWQITDTRPLRDESFTTIVGAELSSAPWEERDAYWVTVAGIPLDFEAPPADDHAGAIRRAAECGAFVIMLHPGLNNLPLAAVDGLPALDTVHAVEIYNHNLAVAGHPSDRFGGWVEVHCDRLDPEALLRSLKVGRYYSTQGPLFRELVLDSEWLHVETSEAYAISLTGGGDRWQSGQERTSEDGETITKADFDLAPFRGSYCRVTAVDMAGTRAWSNPIWP